MKRFFEAAGFTFMIITIMCLIAGVIVGVGAYLYDIWPPLCAVWAAIVISLFVGLIDYTTKDYRP